MLVLIGSESLGHRPGDEPSDLPDPSCVMSDATGNGEEHRPGLSELALAPSSSTKARPPSCRGLGKWLLGVSDGTEAFH